MKLTRFIHLPLISIMLTLLLSACSPDNQGQTQVQTPTVVAPTVPVVAEPEPVPEAELLIQGGILLDMVADEPGPRPIKGIVIRDGKIDSIIAADSTDHLPPAARIINADTNYILPGLIDAHVHFRPFVPDAAIWRRLSLYYGVTTLMDTGPCGETCEETGQDANPWIMEYKDFMNNSPATSGPGLYVTGKRIDGPAEGGHPLAVQVKSQEEIAQYMDLLVEIGSDGIKVESTLPADLRALVMQEANKRGLPVVGHSKDARESIEAGMKFIEHMWPVVSSTLSGEQPKDMSSPQHDHLMDLEKAPEVVKLMVDNGVYLNPTMVGRYGYFSPHLADWAQEDEKNMQFGGLFSDLSEEKKAPIIALWKRSEKISAKDLANYKIGLEKVNTFIRLLSEAGGKVLAATDAGQERLTGISLHREMQMMVDAGITPYRTLLGATRWPAEMIYKDKLIGTVEVGKQADFVITASNPAENITAAQNIVYVVSKGSVQRTPEDCSTVFPPISMSCNKN